MQDVLCAATAGACLCQQKICIAALKQDRGWLIGRGPIAWLYGMDNCIAAAAGLTEHTHEAMGS